MKISLKDRFKSWYFKKFARSLMRRSGQIRIFKMWEEGGKQFHKNLVTSRHGLLNVDQIKDLALKVVQTGQLQPIPGFDFSKAIFVFFETEGTNPLLDNLLTILFDPEKNLFSLSLPAAFYMKDAKGNPVAAAYTSKEMNFGSLAEVFLQNVEAECTADQLNELEAGISVLFQEILLNSQANN